MINNIQGHALVMARVFLSRFVDSQKMNKIINNPYINTKNKI